MINTFWGRETDLSFFLTDIFSYDSKEIHVWDDICIIIHNKGNWHIQCIEILTHEFFLELVQKKSQRLKSHLILP